MTQRLKPPQIVRFLVPSRRGLKEWRLRLFCGLSSSTCRTGQDPDQVGDHEKNPRECGKWQSVRALIAQGKDLDFPINEDLFRGAGHVASQPLCIRYISGAGALSVWYCLVHSFKVLIRAQDQIRPASRIAQSLVGDRPRISLGFSVTQNIFE